MRKQPFSNDGFLALQAELYSMSNSELDAEADQVLIDFKAWMDNHFEFVEEQVNFMNTIDQRMIRVLAAQTSVAVANRQPITLNKTDQELLRSDKKRKIIRSESAATATADSEKEYEADGSLVIFIDYEEL